MFIAAAVLTNKKYLMGAKVLRPARLLLLEAAPFRQMLRDEPDLAIAMLAALSRHFRGLVREVKNLKLKSSAQRLGLYLLGIGEARSGPVTLRLPHQKGVIAARIGIRPETLSRHFATLRNVGVRVRGSQVEIRDLERLAAFCREEGELV
jgi:CRP/FNR family transcriptional activator FtrB